MPYADKEKRKQYHSDYNKTQKYRIYDWKRQGIFIHDEDVVYKRYIETIKCDLCNIVLTDGSKRNDRKCLEHDHISKCIRFVCCNKCNFFLKKRDNDRLKLLLEIHRNHYLKA
tara:strand:+ start:178 stop:516 length:339 start_codon:yes stop_codon:yes gene_type:complete